MCRISVVVPVYQAEATLPDCAASILAGAPDDLELILVEDGSPDGSGAVCDRLAQEDRRVRVIHQANAGASAARNAGLDAAAGDYVTFVDADDGLLPGLWAAAADALREQRPDLYVFGIEYAAGGTELPGPAGSWPALAQVPGLAEVLARQMIGGATLAGPVAKLYRREALGELRFDPALKINEDILFNARFLGRCGPVLFDPRGFYRCDNTGTGSLSRRLRDDLLDAEEYSRPAFAEMLRLLELSDEEQQTLLALRARHCALAQFGLLAGQPGRLPLGRRMALTRRIFRTPDARSALLRQYQADENRLLSLPYRICLRLGLPRTMAVYCGLKSRFL